MAYRIRLTKSIETSLRKIAVEQVEKSIAEIRDPQLGRHQTVHQIRKRCKKLRGLIRLVRPAFRRYQAENQFFRDAAREFSDVRDAQSVIVTLDDLLDHYRSQMEGDAVGPIRQRFVKRRQKIADDIVGLDARLDSLLAKMLGARDRVEAWQIDGGGFEALAGGMKKTFKRGRRALVQARDDPTMENLHEVRKRAKYHWYHTRLLRRAWPDMMDVERAASSELADLLGGDHDLAVLAETLLADAELIAADVDLQLLVGLIKQRQAELRSRIWPLAHRVFAEKPKHMVLRHKAYWKVWRKPFPTETPLLAS